MCQVKELATLWDSDSLGLGSKAYSATVYLGCGGWPKNSDGIAAPLANTVSARSSVAMCCMVLFTYQFDTLHP